jgi:PAS domain S-box-containing protein
MRVLKTIALALAFLIPAVAARELLQGVAPGITPFITLFPAVVAAGVFGGTTTGVLAAIVAVTVADFLWVGSRFNLFLEKPADGLNLALFLVSCLCILWATRSLHRERDRAAAYFDVAGTILAVIGRDGTVRQINQQGVQTLKYDSAGEIIGKNWSDLVVADADPGLRWDQVQKGLAARHNESHQSHIRCKDGTRRLVAWRFAATTRAAGDVAETIASGEDITSQGLDSEERKRVEATLRQQASRLSIALEAGALGTWEVDLASKAVYWDARVAGMLGMEERPIQLHRRDQILFIDEGDRQRVANEFSTAVRTNGLFSSEFRGRTAPGETRWFVSQAVVSRSERRVIGVLRDVTDRRRREDALREALTAREMLIREADHRIKNSLQMVISLLTIQQLRMTSADAADAVTSAIARVEAIAEAHYALQQSKDLRHVDFGKMLRDLCGKLATLRADTAILCTLDGDLTLSADLAIPFALMTSEMLTNALRHAYPANTPGDIIVGATNEGGVLTVSIVDQGKGMAATTGTPGLGTQLIASFAKQLSAKVETRSTPGVGTQILIRIVTNAAEQQINLRQRA